MFPNRYPSGVSCFYTLIVYLDHALVATSTYFMQRKWLNVTVYILRVGVNVSGRSVLFSWDHLKI